MLGALTKAQDHVSDATENPWKVAWPLSGCQVKDHPTQGPHRKQDAGSIGDQTQERGRGQLGPMGGVPVMTWLGLSEENSLGDSARLNLLNPDFPTEQGKDIETCLLWGQH